MNELKSIETVYNGYRFRSRLEARWAIYLDTLGVKYEYEKEGFELEVGRYLPDFWLPQVSMWAEVKANHLTADERNKCNELCLKTGFEVLFLVGSPELKEYDAIAHGECGEIYESPYTLCTQYLHLEKRFFAASGLDDPEDFAQTWPEMLKAVNAARSARFEFGETPKNKVVGT